MTRMLIQTGDPSQYSDYNSAVRTPTTLEHPTYSTANNPAAQAK